MNATVSISLSDIDALRNDLKTAQEQVKTLEGQMMGLKVRLTTTYDEYVTERRHGAYGQRNEFVKKPRTIVETVNLDDIIKDLRDEENRKVENTLLTLKSDVTNRDKKIDQLNLKNIDLERTIKELNERIEMLQKNSGLDDLLKAKHKAEDEIANLKRIVGNLDQALIREQQECRALKLKNASRRYHLKMLVWGV